MKIKSRTSATSIGFEGLNRVGFPHYCQLQPGVTPSSIVEETIEYENNGRKKQNFCYHSRTMTDAPFAVGPTNNVLWVHAGLTPELSWRRVDSFEQWGRKLDGVPTDYTADLGNDKRTAQFNAVTCLRDLGIKPMFNVPLAVAELKDFARTSEYVSDIISLGVKISRARGTAYLQSIPFADLAKGSLWAKFGVKPMWSDARKAFRELQKLELKVKPIENGLWRKGQRLRVPYHVSSVDGLLLHGKAHSIAGRHYAANGTSFVDTRGMFESYTGLVRATFVEGVAYGTLKQTITLDPEAYLRTRFMLGAGLLSTTYELCRLSFLLDHLIDVGSWLRDMERRNVKLPFSPSFEEGIWMTESWQDRVIAEVPKTSIEAGPYVFTGENSGYVDYVLHSEFDKWAVRSVSGNAEGRIFQRAPYTMTDLRPLGSGTFRGIPYKLNNALTMLVSQIPMARLSQQW